MYFVQAQRTEIGVISLYEGMLGRFDLNPFSPVDISPRFSVRFTRILW
jgi:hypothetical protein